MTSKYALRVGALGYLALLLLVPVGFVFYRAFEHGLAPAWHAVTTHQAVHALELTLLIAAIAVPANTVFGVILALALVRGRFPGRGLVNAIVDLPLALSPVVVGLALFLLYGRGGWLGGLADHGIKILFAVPGMVLATMFVSLPFVVREVVPVLREIGTEQEQAAETLGASPFQTGRSRCRRSAGPWPTASCSRPPGRSASSVRSASCRAGSRDARRHSRSTSRRSSSSSTCRAPTPHPWCSR
jgi:sulfate transport system permease protein